MNLILLQSCCKQAKYECGSIESKTGDFVWSLHLYMMKLKMLEIDRKYLERQTKDNFRWTSMKCKPWGMENLSSSK